MAKILGPIEDFSLCQNCQSFDCLSAPWVPQDELDDWVSVWREEAQRLEALEREPSPFEKVRHLQLIQPEELLAFFWRNCQSIFMAPGIAVPNEKI